MPRYTTQPDRFPGEWPGGPVRVFDAEGREVEDVIGCDTETGEVLAAVKNSAGELVLEECGPFTLGVKAQVRTLPAPLRVEPVDSSDAPFVVGGPAP